MAQSIITIIEMQQMRGAVEQKEKGQLSDLTFLIISF